MHGDAMPGRYLDKISSKPIGGSPNSPTGQPNSIVHSLFSM
jgi:hypothetical protein